MSEMDETTAKETELINKSQTEILKMKDWISERKNMIRTFNNITDQMEERISDSKDRKLEIIQWDTKLTKQRAFWLILWIEKGWLWYLLST